MTVKYLFDKAFTEDNLTAVRTSPGHPYSAEAAHKGHYSCLQYLHTVGCGWDSNVTRSAACAGHADCLIYAHEYECEWEPERMAEWACWGGNVVCLSYVIEHDCPLRTNALPVELVRKDNIVCVEYLRGRGVHWPGNALVEALQSDSTKCLAYMLSTGLHFHADLMSKVASEASLQVIHDSGFVFDEGCGARLAHTGNVPLLKYLHKLGCPCGDRTWQEAVRRNHTDVLLYLHAEGYKLTTDHAAFAAGFDVHDRRPDGLDQAGEVREVHHRGFQRRLPGRRRVARLREQAR